MVDELASALDGLAATDLDSLTDPELHDRVVGLRCELTRLQSILSTSVALWDGRRIWGGDGSKTPSARLGRDCRLSRGAAHREVRRARSLRGMPATADAFAAGTISSDHVDALMSVATPEFAGLFARDEKMLLEFAVTLSFRRFRRALSYWRLRADAELGETQAARQHEGRFLDIGRTFQGTVDLRGLLDPVDGTIVLNELQRLERQMFDDDWKQAKAEHGDSCRVDRLARTARQRRADALAEMARRSAAMSPGYTPARPLYTVLVGYETFHGPVCEMFDGTVITPGQAASHLSGADIERIVFDSPSRIIDVGERRRFFTGALRRAIEIRDRTCTFPGCDEPIERCEADHIESYSKGGLTTQDNGRLRCRFHNRQRNNRPDLEPKQDRSTGPAPPDGPDP